MQKPDISPVVVIIASMSISAALAGCGSSGSGSGGGGNGTNRAPTIAGSPPSSVVAGSAYTFTPQAADADGDALVFSAQNVPAWANFNSTSGTISGTPSQADVGMYAGIVISVSDGRQSSSMPGFSINVTQVGTASTTLSWTAPTRNNDGTPLTDLAGYVIYYGPSSRNYTNQIRINNPGVTNFVVDGLAAGTYYFAATAVNNSGVESNFSGEAVARLSGT